MARDDNVSQPRPLLSALGRCGTFPVGREARASRRCGVLAWVSVAFSGQHMVF